MYEVEEFKSNKDIVHERNCKNCKYAKEPEGEMVICSFYYIPKNKEKGFCDKFEEMQKGE